MGLGLGLGGWGWGWLRLGVGLGLLVEVLGEEVTVVEAQLAGRVEAANDDVAREAREALRGVVEEIKGGGGGGPARRLNA